MLRLFALLALMWASPAWADFEWAISSEDDPPANNMVTEVGGGGRATVAFYSFQTEDASVPHDSLPISVRGGLAIFCLNPSNASSGAATATVWIWRVLGGRGVPAVDNNSVRVLDAVLTGAGGASLTQNACSETLPPGVYYVEVIAGSGAADLPYVSVEVVNP